jgi:anti-anti-sigma regulatory factor
MMNARNVCEMAGERVKISDSDGYITVRVSGVLATEQDIDAFSECINQLKERKPREVTIDFASCDIVDTRAIAPLLRLRRELLPAGAALRLINVHHSVYELFVSIGLDQIIAITSR